jgi:hypothetical protein
MIRPLQLNPSDSSYELAIFDIRYTGAAEHLHRERASWQAAANIEATNNSHPGRFAA